MRQEKSSAAGLVGNNKDLVGDILSRLPLSCVVRCRRVCKDWCSLTSAQYFLEKHQNNNINQSSCFVVASSTSKSDHINTLFCNLDKKKMVREYIDLSRSNIFSSDDDDLAGEDEDDHVVDKKKENIYSRILNNLLFHEKKKTYYYDIKLMSSCRGFLLFTAKPAAAPANNMSNRIGAWLMSKHKHKHKEEHLNSLEESRKKLIKREDMEAEQALILYNPLTKEEHTVSSPPSHAYCGFYYHSATKEYRILYQHRHNRFSRNNQHPGCVKFLVFSLQTYRTKTIIQNIANDDPKKYSPTYFCFPDTSSSPGGHVISNGSLHWIVSQEIFYKSSPPSHSLDLFPGCAHTILCFGMESEEFRWMPHPTVLSQPCCNGRRHRNGRRYCNGRLPGKRQRCRCISDGYHHNMNLLEMEGGILCLCAGFYTYCVPRLEIHVMEDYEKWTWVMRYDIDLVHWPANDEYYFLQKYRESQYGKHYKAIQILQGDQLLLHYYSSDRFDEEYLLYSFNQFDIKRLISSINKKKNGQPSASSSSSLVVLSPSLASLQHNYDDTPPPPVCNDTLFSLRTNTSHLFN